MEKSRWDIVALALLIGFIGGMQIGKVPPSIPALRDDLEMGLVTAGWVASLFTYAGAALGAIIGIFSDRLGPRRAVTLSLVALAAGSLSGAIVEDAWLLMATRGLESLGFIGLAVSVPRLITTSVLSKDRNLAFGFWGAWVPGGMAISMLLAPLILPDQGWRGLWFVSGGTAILGVVCLLYMTRPGAWQPREMPQSPIGPLTGLKMILARPGAWLLAACFLLYSVQFLAFMSWLPTFFIERAGFSLEVASLYTALIVAANMIGNVAAGWLLARGLPRPLILAVAYCGMMLSAHISLADATETDMRLIMAFLFSAIGGLIPGTILAAAPVHAPRPDLVGAMNGMVMQGSNIGSLSGPPLMALAISLSGSWQGGTWQNIVYGSIGIWVAYALSRVERRL